MKSLFNSSAHQSILQRIGKLNHDTKALWGKMHVAQMLAHAAITIEAALGERKIPGKGNFLLRIFFKSVLCCDKPYNKNSPTNRHFIISEKKDFNTEMKKLVGIIDKACKRGENGNWTIHPTFGELTNEQWGQSFYKHLDHHLKQFGN